MEEYQCRQSTTLLAFMTTCLGNYSRSKIKKMLKHGQFHINGQAVTQFDYPLQAEQVVQVLSQRESKQENYLQHIKVIYEDADLLVIDKEEGLLSVPTDQPSADEDSALFQVSAYVKAVHPQGQVFSVHRLDRDTSGLMIFAKHKSVQQTLQDQWQDRVKTRAYTMVVQGDFPESSGSYSSWLQENKSGQVISSQVESQGKYAETHFKKMTSNGTYSLLQAELVTGRRNQIRVHMNKLGYPILGDKKYGQASNPLHRLALHASKLSFYHPTSQDLLTFESKPAQSFLDLFNL